MSCAKLIRFALVNALLVVGIEGCASPRGEGTDASTDAIAVSDRASTDAGDEPRSDVSDVVDVVRSDGAVDDALREDGDVAIDVANPLDVRDESLADGSLDDAPLEDVGFDTTIDAAPSDVAIADADPADAVPIDAPSDGTAPDDSSDTGTLVDSGADAPSTCASGTRACGSTCVPDADPRAACGSACVDLSSDPMHCGACATACPATQICSAGSCRCGGSAPTYCAAFAACVDTTSDTRHCGSCGHACGAGERCIHSYCQLPYTCSSIDGSSYAPIAAMAADVTGDGTRTLASIMAVFPGGTMRRTPGLSVAVREADGTIHATVFGDANNSSFDPSAPALNRSTLFQAGSVSKPVSALAYLMSEIADPTRTIDIRPTVASLVVPPYAITPSDLLTHTAGTSVHGFTGYLPGAPLPTIDQIVLGVAPANSMTVTFGTPGTWLYSGGGYILWEAWLERTTAQDLPDFVHDLLFVPAGATRSSFAQPLAAIEHDAACGSDPSYPAGVCRLVEPEYAAAGLWTTPTELACIAGYATSRRPDALTRVISRAVPIPSYPQRQGLGLRHRPANGVDETAGHFYEHSGVNIGYCNTLAFFSDGRAIVAMDNSCAGVSAVVVRALCLRLGWTCGGPSLAAF